MEQREKEKLQRLKVVVSKIYDALASTHRYTPISEEMYNELEKHNICSSCTGCNCITLLDGTDLECYQCSDYAMTGECYRIVDEPEVFMLEVKSILQQHMDLIEDGECECKPEWLIYETTDTNTFPYGEDYGVYRCNHCNKIHYKVK